VSLASDPHAILIRACGTENEDRWTGMIAAPVTCVVAPTRREKDAGIFRMKSKKRALYRNWLDEPIPALGDRTPCYAAKLKTIRPKLMRS